MGEGVSIMSPTAVSVISRHQNPSVIYVIALKYVIISYIVDTLCLYVCLSHLYHTIFINR